MIKHLPEDVLFEGVTYPKGETEVPEELAAFIDALNKMVNPVEQHEAAPQKPQTRRGIKH